MKLIKSKKLSVYLIPIKRPKIFFESSGNYMAKVTNYTCKPVELIFNENIYTVQPKRQISPEEFNYKENVQLKLRFLSDIKPIEGFVYFDIYKV